MIEAQFNGGAYGAFTPRGITPHSGGVVASYKVPEFYSSVTRVYTNTVPRGNCGRPALRRPCSPSSRPWTSWPPRRAWTPWNSG